MSAPATIAIVLAVAIPLQLVRAYRVKDAHVEAWARDHGLELEDGNRPVVAGYLRRAQVARTWGGIAGVIVPSLIDLVFNGRVQVLGFGTDGTTAPLGFGTIFIGYLLGALYAEVVQARPVAGAARKASLAPRELDAYLSRRVILAQRALTAVVALGLLAVGVVPVPASFSTPSFGSLVLASMVVVAFGVGLEAIERWLVRRPQPFTSPSLVATDDAIRAQSIHMLAGAGLALLLLGCSGVALALQASEVEVLHATMLVPAGVCVVLALFVWQGIGERAWRVRRPVPPAST